MSRSKRLAIRCSRRLPFWLVRMSTALAKSTYSCGKSGFHCPRSFATQKSKIENRGRLPEMSNFYCHPGKAGGSPSAIRWFVKVRKVDQLSFLTTTFLIPTAGR